MNKILIFGSCNSYGLELYPAAHIDGYTKLTTIEAYLQDSFSTYADVVQNLGESEDIKKEISYCRMHAWPGQLQLAYPDVEIKNYSIGQTNLANFIRLTSYLETANIDKANTKIIIEITEPTGVTVSDNSNNTIKSYAKPYLSVFVGKKEAATMDEFLDKNESPRYRAYLDLITVKNLISDLKYNGYDVDYFIWDRALWYDVIHNTEPFKLFIEYGNWIDDNFNCMFEEFLKNSMLTEDEEKQLKAIPALPQTHYSQQAQDLLGKFILKKIGDNK
jgi:hypothetical protein